jgi:hypothetical protein
MALDDDKGEVVLSGTWLYDGAIPKLITIIARNFDYSYDPDNEDCADHAETPLGPDGRLYYVTHSWQPYQTLAEAKAWADAQPWGPVKWMSQA